MLKVGYDAQAFLSANGGTGKGVQLRNLVGPFLDCFVGFASTDPNSSPLPLVQEGLSSYTLWQQLSLPASLRRHNIDLFLAPYNIAPFRLPKHTELILVLHDTILLQGFRKPDLRGRFMDFYRRLQIPRSVARARIVLTVSEHARTEILQAFPQANVQVIPCTIPALWFDPRPLQYRAGYILMVTSNAPHKNALGGLKGYAEYARRAGHAARPLKIAGLSGQQLSYRETLTSNGIMHLVSFLPFLSEEALFEAYRDAGALLFPSFAEGFGIPMLEAMATGTPVVAARAASLPEVGADAARYFDPGDPVDIADALEAVLSDKARSLDMARKGLLRSLAYHPEIIAQHVIDFWKEVAGVSPPHTLLAHPVQRAAQALVS